MFKSTTQHAKYWRDRKIDWKIAYTETADHLHRDLILKQLSRWNFGSLFEAGCASGPNLIRIAKRFPHVALGGCDINDDAIRTAQETLGPTVVLQADPLWSIFHSDKSADVVLTDAALIYIGPEKIHTVLEEFRRVGRKHLLLVEFHSRNPLKRFLLRLLKGYNSYDYKKLLEQHEFDDIQITKLPDLWDGEPWKTYGHLITARI
jgi:ubiquinone/menaquinone biosynthesis C-methylase UbiE